jgi:PST family polysaccharide transporter
MSMLTAIRRMAGSRLAGNLLAIYLARMVNIIIPLAMVPIFARVLDPATFGLTLLAQALGLWIVQVVEFGYDFSATRRLARADWSEDGWKLIVRDTLFGQNVLVLLCLVGSLAFLFLVEGFAQSPLILLLAWAYGAMAGYTPRWYFYAREELAGFTTVSILGRAAGAVVSVLAAILTHSGEGIMFGYAVGSLIPLVWCLWIILPKIGHLPLDMRAGLETLREGGGIFAFKISKMVYSLGGVTVVGILATPTVLAQYASSDRLVRAGINLATSFTIAFFPRLSQLVETDRAAARRMFLTITGLSVAMMTVAAIVVTFNSELIVAIILGEGYEAAAPVLALLIWVAPLNMYQFSVGTQWMIPLGMERAFSAIIAGAAVIYVGLALWAVQHGGETLALANVAAEFVLCLALTGYVMLTRRRGGAT